MTGEAAGASILGVKTGAVGLRLNTGAVGFSLGLNSGATIEGVDIDEVEICAAVVGEPCIEEEGQNSC